MTQWLLKKAPTKGYESVFVIMTHIVYSMAVPLFALSLFLFCVTESEQTALALCFLGLAPVVST